MIQNSILLLEIRKKCLSPAYFLPISFKSVGILRQSRHIVHLGEHATGRDQKYRDCSMFLYHLSEPFSHVCYQPNDFCRTILVSILHLSIFLFFSCTKNHTYNNQDGHKEGHSSLTLSSVNQNLGFQKPQTRF